jgi:hypothetical protein
MLYKFALVGSLLCLASCASSAHRVSCPLPLPGETVSIGDVCNTFGVPLCKRLFNCGFLVTAGPGESFTPASSYETQSVAQCATEFKERCCSETDDYGLSKKPLCSRRVEATHKELVRCSADIMEMSCHDIALIPDKTAKTMPISCTTL